MMEFFEKKLEFAYPYPKYDQAVVRDFSGGMENITAATLEDKVVHDRRALLDHSPDELVAHELVHQWFGNMVTCRSWGDLWLNEGFAVLFANLWIERHRGADDYLYAVYQDQQTYSRAWTRGNRRPLSTTRFDDPEALFDQVTYHRAGSVLAMMRFVLGDEMFWKAVRHYLKKHAWQTVETQQLVVAIEEATGQNLQWFFDEWVYRTGHPEFEVTATFDEATRALKLKVRQTQTRDDKFSWYQSPDYYMMPVDIAVTTALGEKVHRLLIDKAENEFTLSVDSKPLIINFDRGNRLIKRVKFDREPHEIAYQLTHDSDVTGRIRAAVELRAARSDVGIAALSEAAVKDRFWGVRLEAVQALAELKAPEARPALLNAVKDSDARVRRAATRALALFKDPKMADLFIKLTKDPSYSVVAEAAQGLAHTGDGRAFNVLAGLMKQESWEDTIRVGALTGLCTLGDPRSHNLAMAFAASGRTAAVRELSFRLLGQIGNGSDLAKDGDGEKKILRARVVNPEGVAAQSPRLVYSPTLGTVSIAGQQR
jgi:aminopeptidase N